MATLPSISCEAMPRKQKRIAQAGDKELLAHLDPKDRTRVLTEAMLKRKIERCSTTRCQRCWFPTDDSGTNRCICSKLTPLSFRKNVRFLIYLHPRDWYNAGDDAKILLSAAPDRTELFVFGHPGHDERLREALAQAPASVLLFPDDSAILVDEFLARLRKQDDAAVCSETDDADNVELSIVVIDGTWNNVKQMQKHFTREIGPTTPHVKLLPTSLSVYARTQTRKDGVSSIEAVALLLRELGESVDTCDALVGYLEVNNEALRLRPKQRDEEDE